MRHARCDEYVCGNYKTSIANIYLIKIHDMNNYVKHNVLPNSFMNKSS